MLIVAALRVSSCSTPRLGRGFFYVDGFNLYYSLIACSKADPTNACFKWFDLYTFLTNFLRKDGSEQLGDIYYFSAYFPWDATRQPFADDPSKEARHKIYRKALESYGIHTIFGYFRKKRLFGPHSGKHFEVPEEKQTEVSIAVSIVRDAALDRFDKGILISGDTDFLPVFFSLTSVRINKCRIMLISI